MDIYTVQGITKYNPFLADYNYGGNMRAVFNGVKVNYWTPENPTGNFPRPTTNGALEMGSIARQDASYVRLQNITIGYTLPKNLTQRFFVEKLRVYVSGQNLWTSTNYSGYNPEVNARPSNSLSPGEDYGTYPLAKTFLFGLNITL